jgi:hypothetical protein
MIVTDNNDDDEDDYYDRSLKTRMTDDDDVDDSCLFTGVFDDDGKGAKDDLAGRDVLVVDLARLHPRCTYCTT